MPVYLGAGLLLCAALYLFLTAPRRPRREKWPLHFFQYDFAHRGLYGGTVPENSLRAFDLAAGRGYGIELDVQLSRDGQLIVFHDATLSRMCGDERRINDLTGEELKRYRLGGSDETIPTFDEALACVQGRTPLIIELKTAGKRNAELARKTHERLKSYRGGWAVESFDPRLMRWFRKNAPQVIRGQLAYDPRLGGPSAKCLRFRLLANLLMNWLSRPDFIAYCHETDKNPSFQFIHKLFHPVLVAWTVRSHDTYRQLQDRYDLQIFEGFEP